MERKTWVGIVTLIILIVIMIILGLSISNYDSTKESSGMLKIGMLLAALFISSISNVLAGLYLDFLSNSKKSSSEVGVGRNSLFKN